MTAKWLRRFGRCIACPNPASGDLMDEHNGSLGAHCEKCAKKRIATEQAREAEYEKLRKDRP